MPLMRANLALACALILSASACAKHTEAAATPPPATLTAANRAAAAAVGRRLAAQDRAAERAHREEIDRLIDARVVNWHEADRTISLQVRVHNKSAKQISRLGAGLEIDAKSSARRLGLVEVDVTQTVPGNGDVLLWLPLRYLRFGEDAGTMRLAQGQPKRISLRITEIKYADGTDAGYDD